ncbi:MAG TPA: hypothetical protein PLN24_09090, partial [Victivallales bacterium]|nr:hypothetical protein [Victivallales bacterium]
MKNRTGIELWKKPDGIRWVWVEKEKPNQFVALYLKLQLPAIPVSASIALFADTKYKLYVNGKFVNAGPAPFWKPVVMIDEYDLKNFLVQGENHILVIAHFIGADTKYNMKEYPGVIALFQSVCEKKEIIIPTGAKDWKIIELNCWNFNTPRKNWAIEYVEELNLNHPDFKILSNFASEDYYSENSKKYPEIQWRKPRSFERDDIEIRKRLVPPLRWKNDELTTPKTIFRGNTELYNLQDTAVRLDHEFVWKEYEEAQYEYTRETVKLERRIGEPGFLILYDFKRMMAGDPAAEIFVENPCRLEFAMAEDLTDSGRPIVWRNGGLYYARYHLSAGINKIRFYHFNGFRFLYLVFKDVVGKVEIRKVSSKSCRANLNYQDDFSSNDRLAESVYRICRRSIKLNTQAFCYDCNTREQGTYLGDGIWITESVGHMTGDFSHLRHLCLAANDEIKKTGPLLNASLFGMATPLIDYCFVPVIALKKYYEFTGDIDCVKDCIETARAIVHKFQEFKDENGFITQKKIKEIMGSDFKGFLFLDHQGNGWHPMTTVGLDRRDINSGLNFYYLWALQSLLVLEKVLGNNPGILEKEIKELKKKSKTLFFIKSVGLFADAVDKNIKDLRFSQISNALGIISSVIKDESAEYILRTVLDINRHTWVSMGTPYSYFFLAEAISKCKKVVPEAVRCFSEVFRGMLDRGATTTWES